MPTARLERICGALGRFAAARSGWIVLATLVISAGLLAAVLAFPAPAMGIRYVPDDPAVQAEERIDAELPRTAFPVPFLVSGTAEANGNALSRHVFDEILAREDAVRRDPRIAPYVFSHVSPYLQIEVSSVWSLPDTLRAVMDGDTPLTYVLGWHELTGGPGTSYARATDSEWQDALTRVLEYEPRPGERPFARSVSVDAERVAGVWHAKSVFVVANLHHATVFLDHVTDSAAATPERPLFEDLEFHVWRTMEADAAHTEWIGIGLGIQHEVSRQVGESARLVAVSLVLMGVILYATLRNWRDWLVSYLSIPLVVVWMLGLARLLGLENNQFTAMLPVLILALGVDFAIHGVRRYREERGANAPHAALARSIRFVGPVLFLAAMTTSLAFLANGPSRVPALRHWGLMGGVGILAAFWVCGVFAPAARHLWDRRRERHARLQAGGRGGAATRRLREGTPLGALAAAGARRPWLVIAAVALVTLPAAVLATGITSDFNADEFLSRDSYLLEGTGRMREEYPREGEPAILLVEGDVGDPRVLDALLAGFTAYSGRGYRVNLDFSILRVIQTAMENPDENDAHYPDADGNGVPDRREDAERLIARVLEHGVWARVEFPPLPPPEPVPGVPLPDLPLPDVLQDEPPEPDPVLVYAPETVRELVAPRPGGGYGMAVIHFAIPGTEDFAMVERAAEDLRESAADLYALRGEGVDALTLAGEPMKRLGMVQAITASLQISITLSVIGCFLILLVALRDVAVAVVTTLPVLILVTWLFAFMVLAGMSLNVVTVTVAAMAIGVGIDYSIHLTGRFREEAGKGLAPVAAIRRAMDSSGVALLGSATTTVAGFLVLLFAPMPLFATFGLITAAMTAASFLAAATILPPMLVLIYDRRPRRASRTS